jgi:ABC-type cobalamin/Fe3+-siderophores transport system ATPase subunit
VNPFRHHPAHRTVDGRIIVKPTTLGLRPSFVYGLVGPNGSGKSSLVRLLARQQAHSGGRITLLGKDLGSYGDREFARTPGMERSGVSAHRTAGRWKRR